MNTTTSQALLASNPRALDDRSSKGFFYKKKSKETIAKEKAEAKYTSRKNVCDGCWQAKSSIGACGCP